MRLNCWLCWLLVICLHLPLQLLGLAAEHLLLPALLRSLLLALLLLLGQFLLPLGELLQLLERLVDLLLAAAAAAAGRLRLAALVLILFGIEFEVEQTLHVARGAAAAATAAAAALLAEGHLDIAERRFGAHQVLQRLLLGRQRILPLGALQLLGRRTHRLDRLFHVLDEALERIARAFELAGLHAVGQRLGLVAQFGLHAGQERGVLGIGALARPAPLTWFQVAVMISFCRCEIWF